MNYFNLDDLSQSQDPYQEVLMHKSSYTSKNNMLQSLLIKLHMKLYQTVSEVGLEFS